MSEERQERNDFMKKENRIVIFGILFIAALLAEIYVFIQYRTEIFVVVLSGIMVLFTAYLFFDQIMDVFGNKHSEEKIQLEERLRELEKVQKAIYMVSRNTSQSMETSIQLQTELRDVLNRSAKLIAKYNRQDLKNLAAANGSYTNDIIAALEKGIGSVPNADSKGMSSATYDSIAVTDAVNRNGEAVRFKVEGGFELVESDLSDIGDTLRNIYQVLTKLEEKIEEESEHWNKYINKDQVGDNSSKIDLNDIISPRAEPENREIEAMGAETENREIEAMRAELVNIEMESRETKTASTAADTVDVMPEMEADVMDGGDVFQEVEVEDKQDELPNEIIDESEEAEELLQDFAVEDDQEQWLNDVLANLEKDPSQILAIEEEKEVASTDEDFNHVDMDKAEDAADLLESDDNLDTAGHFSETIDNILDTLDGIGSFEASDDLQSLIDADLEFDMQEMMDLDRAQDLNLNAVKQEENEIDIQTVLEQLRPRKPEPTPIIDMEDDYVVNTLDDGEEFKLVPDSPSESVNKLEADLPQEDLNKALDPDEIANLFASMGQQ